MLQSLNIVNFAIIDDSVIDFTKGVTVFTGETGAGKSIVFDALAVLSGRRASIHMIRNGADSFRVEGIFSMDSHIRSLVESMGIDADDEQLVISRKMTRKGRGTCTINGSFCTLKQIQTLGEQLVILHEQNDNLGLLSSDSCREMIDSTSDQGRQLWESYHQAYASWAAVKKQLEEFQEKKQEHERRLDILQWEIQQISDAAVHAGEDDEISRNLERLENQEKIHEKLGKTVNLLTEEEGVNDRLAEAVEQLESVSGYDENLQPVMESMQNAYYTLQEAASNLQSYQDSQEYSEEELNNLQSRDELLNDLKRKYGPTLDDVLSYLKSAEMEYEKLHTVVYENDKLQEKFKQQTLDVMEAMNRLYQQRVKAGRKFCERLMDALHIMGMPGASLELHLVPSDVPVASGAREMEFYFSANVGEELLPLRKTASGGEISRIALAIEVITAPLFRSRTLVFDEIDTGISGQAALQVARQIKKLGESVQVLCITHLPQTASIGTQYYHIQKEVLNGRTITRATRRNHEEHLADVAHIISGDSTSKAALNSAAELEKLLSNT